MMDNDQLRTVLEARFLGSLELSDLPIKTRGKRARIMACEALSYVVPKSFKRTRPRFSEEQFDIIVQRSKNFQPWNRDIRLDQRYAFIVLDGAESVTAVHVLSGLDVAALPQTGKRTIKFQARFRDYAVGRSEPVIHGPDTERLLQYRETNSHLAHALTVGVMPTGGLMTIHQIGAVLGGLLGESLSNPGATQERLRGQALHERVCDILGYDRYADSGQHPDIPNQLLEIKLQTSPTIDLGLVDPGSEEHLPPPYPRSLRVADVRYAVFGVIATSAEALQIHSVHLIAGADFNSVFEPFGGLGQNSKLQIRLPAEWFGQD